LRHQRRDLIFVPASTELKGRQTHTQRVQHVCMCVRESCKKGLVTFLPWHVIKILMLAPPYVIMCNGRGFLSCSVNCKNAL